MTWTVTFDAKREPMFMDEQGGGWVPVARFNELEDALRTLRQWDMLDACADGPWAKRLIDDVLGGLS
jgi:hypothetical protein